MKTQNIISNKKLDKQFSHLIYYTYIKLQLEEYLKYILMYLTDLKDKYNIILELQ